MEDLQAEAEKAAMETLNYMNETLTEQLQQHGSPLASSSPASTQQERTSGGVGDRPGEARREVKYRSQAERP